MLLDFAVSTRLDLCSILGRARRHLRTIHCYLDVFNVALFSSLVDQPSCSIGNVCISDVRIGSFDTVCALVDLSFRLDLWILKHGFFIQMISYRWHCICHDWPPLVQYSQLGSARPRPSTYLFPLTIAQRPLPAALPHRLNAFTRY
jgi:hypothetical protein